MGFSIRSALLAVVLAGLFGPAAPLAASASIPGPPLDSTAAWGSACAATRAPEGPWQAAGFGAAVVGVGWIARRQGARD